MHFTQIIIDSKQLINNVKTIRNRIGYKCKYCLPLKANAYGHGLLGVANIVEKYVDYFAVGCLDEGIALRQNGIKLPILVFGGFFDQQILELVSNDLEVTITSLEDAISLFKFCTLNSLTCKVHIKINTGMNRGGVFHHQAKEVIEYILNNPIINLVGIYSHFISSDAPVKDVGNRQISLFAEISDYAKSLKPELICHMANSGGVVFYPESYFDMVRPGILTYGHTTYPDRAFRIISVKPCFQLVSKVMHITKLPKGSGVSYDHNYKTSDNENIATIPIGYGDGWRRSLFNKKQELIIRNKKYLIVGNICMDMLMARVDDDVRVGDEVLLIGFAENESVTVREISEQLGTIDAEVMAGFTSRIPRIYI